METVFISHQTGLAIIFAGFMIPGLSGCSANNSSSENIFSVVKDLNSGKYEKRLQERRNSLQALQKQQHINQQRLKRLELERNQDVVQLQQQQSQLRATQQKKDTLARTASEKSQRHAALKKRLVALQQSIDKTNQQIKNQQGQSVQQKHKLAQLTRERNQLRQQLSQLIDTGL